MSGRCNFIYQEFRDFGVILLGEAEQGCNSAKRRYDSAAGAMKQGVEEKLIWANQKGSVACEAIMKPTKLVIEEIVETAKRAGAYIKAHWPHIIAYIVAWGLIVALSGAMYGFQAVALPLTIGIACGLALGVLTGILTATVLDRDRNKKWSKYNTLWGLINFGLDHVDSTGTKNFLTAIVVSVTLAASLMSPHGIGGAIGFTIASFAVTKMLQFDPVAHQKKVDAEKERHRRGIYSTEERLDDQDNRQTALREAQEQQRVEFEHRMAALEQENQELRAQFLHINQQLQHQNHGPENNGAAS